MIARLGWARATGWASSCRCCLRPSYAVLALGKLKAIYIPIFSGYAAPAVASRLNDAGASLLVTVDGTYRRGAQVRLKEIADEAVNEAPSVKHMLVVGRLSTLAPQDGWVEGRDRWWSTEMADPNSNR